MHVYMCYMCKSCFSSRHAEADRSQRQAPDSVVHVHFMQPSIARPLPSCFKKVKAQLLLFSWPSLTKEIVTKHVKEKEEKEGESQKQRQRDLKQKQNMQSRSASASHRSVAKSDQHKNTTSACVGSENMKQS